MQLSQNQKRGKIRTITQGYPKYPQSYPQNVYNFVDSVDIMMEHIPYMDKIIPKSTKFRGGSRWLLVCHCGQLVYVATLDFLAYGQF